MKTLLTILIVVTLFAIQYFLSTRKSFIFGAIIPVLVIPFAIWVINVRSLSVNFDTIWPFAGLFIVFTSIWAESRECIKKKQEKELDKMKAKDIN